MHCDLRCGLYCHPATPSLDAPALQLINRLGRRRITTYSFLICGVACMLCAAVPAGTPGSANATLRIAAAVVGKFGAAAAFALLFVFTTELFPTVVRSAALGANSAAARLGGVIAPLVVLLAALMHAGTLSFAVFGLTSFAAGAGPCPPSPSASLPFMNQSICNLPPPIFSQRKHCQVNG